MLGHFQLHSSVHRVRGRRRSGPRRLPCSDSARRALGDLRRRGRQEVETVFMHRDNPGSSRSAYRTSRLLAAAAIAKPHGDEADGDALNSLRVGDVDNPILMVHFAVYSLRQSGETATPQGRVPRRQWWPRSSRSPRRPPKPIFLDRCSPGPRLGGTGPRTPSVVTLGLDQKSSQ